MSICVFRLSSIFSYSLISTNDLFLAVNKSEEVVTVILMPHSHNDPGWLLTFDDYHNSRNLVMFENLVGGLGGK